MEQEQIHEPAHKMFFYVFLHENSENWKEC